MNNVTGATGWSAEARFYVHIITGLTVSLPTAYVFHRFFERPITIGPTGRAVNGAVSEVARPAIEA